ncbi:hypothetical protein [Malaciobacter marinus]|uniref:hypothetical protein n=1 Tax=Malaciobacter marinus TaxID=505249 RepID=UPI003AFFC0E6
MKINSFNNQDIHFIVNKNIENKEVYSIKKSESEHQDKNNSNNLLIISINSIKNISTENFLKLKNEIDKTEENIKNKTVSVKRSESSNDFGPLEMLYKKLQELQKQIAQLMSKISKASEEEIKMLMEQVSALTAQVSTINNQIQQIIEK